MSVFQGAIFEKKADFLEALQRVDIDVLEKSKGTQFHEQWLICNVLPSLLINEPIALGYSIIQRDRPDFLLEIDSQKIGIEVTQACSEDMRACEALLERENPDGFIEISHFRCASEKKLLEEKRQIINQDRLMAVPYSHDEMEQEWAKFIIGAIEKKSEDLNKDGFEQFKKNWLFVHDRTSLIGVRIDEAASIAFPRIKEIFSGGSTFDVVFVKTEQQIVIFSEESVAVFNIESLWEDNSIQNLKLRSFASSR